MSKQLYRNFVILLKKWPADESKKGRDLGEFIRSQFAIQFPKGETSAVSSPIQCKKNFESLNRIANNSHSTRYPRIYKSSAMGMTPDMSGKVVSNEIIEELNK